MIRPREFLDIKATAAAAASFRMSMKKDKPPPLQQSTSLARSLYRGELTNRELYIVRDPSNASSTVSITRGALSIVNYRCRRVRARARARGGREKNK